MSPCYRAFLLVFLSFTAFAENVPTETHVPALGLPDPAEVEKLYGRLALAPVTGKEATRQMVAGLVTRHVDGNRSFFLKGDVDELTKLPVFENYCANDLKWVDTILKKAEARIDSVKKMLEEIGKEKLALESGEKIPNGGVWKDFPVDEAEAKTRTRQIVTDIFIAQIVEQKIDPRNEAALRELQARVITFVSNGYETRRKALLGYTDHQKKELAIGVRLGCGDKYGSLLSPQETLARGVPASNSCGLEINLASGRPPAIVAGVNPGSQASEMKNVEVGALVTAVKLTLKNGEKAEFRFEDAETAAGQLADFNVNKANAILARCEVEVKRGDGTKETFVLSPQLALNSDHTVKMQSLVVGGKALRVISIPNFHMAHHQGKWDVGTADQVRRLMKLPGKYDGIVLDLKNNPGGSTVEANAVAAMFLDKEAPQQLMQLTRRDDKGALFSAPEIEIASETYPDKPLFVLVNGKSASASEMVAASLKDKNRAILIGDTTYGKATQMSNVSNPTQQTYLFTSGIRRTPNGSDYQSTGLVPDIRLVEQGALGVGSREPFQPKLAGPEVRRAPLSFEKPGYYQVDRTKLEGIQRHMDGVFAGIKPGDLTFVEARDRVGAVVGRSELPLSLSGRMTDERTLAAYRAFEIPPDVYRASGFAFTDVSGQAALVAVREYLK